MATIWGERLPLPTGHLGAEPRTELTNGLSQSGAPGTLRDGDDGDDGNATFGTAPCAAVW
jgi:hypothetical protein